MCKFFNLNENPFTMDLDLSEIHAIELKVDGSLISTFHHEGRLACKSKGSINSFQSSRADALLEENLHLYQEIRELAYCGFTVNMEYLPRSDSEHRVVIGHPEESLVVLSVRNNENGEYHGLDKLVGYPELIKLWVDYVYPPDPEDFVKQIGNMDGVEGYIVYLPHICFKAKTLWYLTQHRAKDSVNSPRRLYEAVIAESTDDLRSLFFGDPHVIAKIDAMEQKVGHWYNELVEQVETFYAENKDLERKWYAIKGQQELPKIIFGLAMQKYIGREINYKEFMIKKWKEFGIKDEEESHP
jgi:T4 RnlA family RNA ligase